MKKELISLDEHNRRKAIAFQKARAEVNSPKPNGLACPNCGKELVDDRPMQVLTSYPPKKSVKCSSCEYHGFRIA